MSLLYSLIPSWGFLIGTLPALTALVIYAIFPILENTVTALNGIDPSLVKKLNRLFGMTSGGLTQEV